MASDGTRDTCAPLAAHQTSPSLVLGISRLSVALQLNIFWHYVVHLYVFGTSPLDVKLIINNSIDSVVFVWSQFDVVVDRDWVLALLVLSTSHARDSFEVQSPILC
jgi:hypothetical protein